MIRQIMIQIRSLLDVIVQQDERIVLVDQLREQNMIVFRWIQMMYVYHSILLLSFNLDLYSGNNQTTEKSHDGTVKILSQYY